MTMRISSIIFAKSLDGLPRHDLSAHRGLDCHVKHLPGYQLLHLFSEDSTPRLHVISMHDNCQCVDAVTIDQHI